MIESHLRRSVLVLVSALWDFLLFVVKASLGLIL